MEWPIWQLMLCDQRCTAMVCAPKQVKTNVRNVATALWHTGLQLNPTERLLCRRIMGHADGFHRYELTLRPLECVKLAERLGTCEQHFFPFFPLITPLFHLLVSHFSSRLLCVCKCFLFSACLDQLSWSTEVTLKKKQLTLNGSHRSHNFRKCLGVREGGFYYLSREERQYKGNFLNVRMSFITSLIL